MSDEQWQKTLGVVCAVALFLAIPAIWPYGYYQLLRWLICLSAAYFTYLSFQANRTAWGVIMVVLAVLFNPIAPVGFVKSTWVIFDFIAALVFLGIAFAKRKHV